MRNLILIATVAALAGTGAVAHSDKIPIGDGKISTSPRVGYVMSCRTRFNSNAGGAHQGGDWIKGDYWYPALKPVVDGAVKWSNGGVKVILSGNKRRLAGKGLPTHTTGVYPIARTDDAYEFDRNPNTIKSRAVALRLPANPVQAASASCLPMGMIGVAITGAAIFNALDGPGRDAMVHEIQDECGGHPERSGQYHYHGPSKCMTEIGKGSDGHSGLVGYALDGFGIYGLKGARGAHMSSAVLDSCHGHTEAVVWDGSSVEIYHYHLTPEYPYTLGCFKGTPVSGN